MILAHEDIQVHRDGIEFGSGQGGCITGLDASITIKGVVMLGR
jgi:hypothetical protein